MTIHDHKFICPHYAMSRDGVTCMECKGRKYGHAIRHKCINGALAPSIVCSLEMLLHRLLRIYEKNVDLFISPSRFLADNLSADGFMASAMMHIPNFTDTDLFTPSESVDDYVLYYGKIERPKGVHLLIEAVAELSKTRTVRCLMVGDGDDRPALEKNAGKSGGIEFLGRRSGAELRDIVRRARCVVVPSVCLENGSMVIIESMASGRPVVASRSGGNPEYVADGVTGMLFTSGDAHDLAEKLVAVLADPARADAMGRAGRKTAIERLSLKAHYEKIMVAYHAAIKAAGLR